MERIKSNVTLVMLATILIAFVSASANEVEEVANLQVKETPVQNFSKRQSIDTFTIAIIGLSLGCMLIASSTHWIITKRKELQANIQTLESSLSSIHAIELQVLNGNGYDFTIDKIKDLKNEMQFEIATTQNEWKQATQTINRVEMEIIRLWG